MSSSSTTLDDVVDAIQDLTRVIIATSGVFESKSDAIRRLSALSIPAGRIAAILAMSIGDVSSAISKANKKKQIKVLPTAELPIAELPNA